jgi:hypothetical protein
MHGQTFASGDARRLGPAKLRPVIVGQRWREREQRGDGRYASGTGEGGAGTGKQPDRPLVDDRCFTHAFFLRLSALSTWLSAIRCPL